MSATDAAPTPTAIARRRITGRAARAGSRSSSWSPGRPSIRWQFGGMITAAATTAPLVGATPTSSTPAIRVAPSRHRGRSQRSVGTIRVIGRQRTAPARRPGRRVGHRGRARLGRCSGASRRSTCSRRARRSATRSRSCSTATGSRPTRCSGSRAGRTCPRRRSSLPPTTPAADYACGSSPRPRRSRSPATRRSAPATRGSRRAACRATRRAIVQECGSGLVEVRRTATGSRSASRRCSARARSTRPTSCGSRPRSASTADEILDATWCDNGPGWMAILLASAAAVLEIRIGPSLHLDLGIVGPVPARARRPRSRCARPGPQHGSIVEDPATGSLNASVARWLHRRGQRHGAVRGDAGRGDRAGRADRRHPGPGRDDPRRRPERDARDAGRSTSSVERGPGHGTTPARAGVGRGRWAGRTGPGLASGARGASSRPCRRGCAGSTASRGGPGRGG